MDIGERAGSGIPDFISTWQKYVEFNQEYEITHNPDRTKLTIPYTIAALQRAGSKLIDGVQVVNSDTTETNSDTKKESSNTKNINDRAKTKDFINDRLKNSANINDKFSITDDVVDKLVDIYCYLESNQSSKGDTIGE